MTAKVNGTDNSVSAPAFVGSDTATGIYFPTTGQMAISISGTQTALFASTGVSNITLSNPTVTNYLESVVAIGNSGTSQTLSLTNGTVQTVTLTGNCTFTMPTATAGKSFILIVSTGAGGFTGTFTSVKWPSNTAPTLTTTATRWDILTFVADGTNWYGAYQQAYQ
jgi:hypothetical protein